MIGDPNSKLEVAAERLAFGAFEMVEKLPTQALRFLGALVAMPLSCVGMALSIPLIIAIVIRDIWRESEAKK